MLKVKSVMALPLKFHFMRGAIYVEISYFYHEVDNLLSMHRKFPTPAITVWTVQ